MPEPQSKALWTHGLPAVTQEPQLLTEEKNWSSMISKKIQVHAPPGSRSTGQVHGPMSSAFLPHDNLSLITAHAIEKSCLSCVVTRQ